MDTSRRKPSRQDAKIECPNLLHPRYYVDPKTDDGYEGSYVCSLVDKYCLVEYGNGECEVYNDYLKEEAEADESKQKRKEDNLERRLGRCDSR